MSKKTLSRSEYREVFYDDERWAALERLRQRAIVIMESLDTTHIYSIVHGSVARGDVTSKSDINVFVPDPASSFSVETALEKAGIASNRRFVVQATPVYAMKAYIEIDETADVSFPLMPMRKVEREFYRFGGEASLKELKDNRRKTGVDKRLMLIEPTQQGHNESTIVGREDHAARLVGTSVETVLDRVHALRRRDHVGRTGVFLKEGVRDDETFEMALKRLSDSSPAVRRRLSSL